MRTGGLVVAAVAVLAMAGCTPQGDEDPVPAPTATRTVVTRAAVPLPTLPHHRVAAPVPEISVVDNTIRVGGDEYDVSPLRADSAVSTRGGVYFLNTTELWHLEATGAVGTTLGGVTRLAVSGNGRYLGLVDRKHGPIGADRVQVATVVVYDTTTGKVVLESRKGMARAPEGSTLAAAYRSEPPHVLTFRDRALVASTPNGVYVYPLSGARPHLRS